ncbi:Protein of unknown function [Melghirimyces thermohalophilus]|uniref:DUF3055 domain-containing protein n=1 Tax=Melghirimyces thermohalophilus TaxID=1236220 RepID=A0A1G6L2T2_9BACL|nr:DUF3055 domain-containing protein [Melghirimyces thermohalophilus]SDC37620.1 Protein of unknown function [Melghirimyces thermohalophilus]
MSNGDFFFLYDENEETQTRFVSFMGETNRFDLGITMTDRFYGKMIVFNIQSNRFAIIGPDDLEEPGYLERVYDIGEDEAEELKQYLSTFF